MVDVSRHNDRFRNAVALARGQLGVVTVGQLLSLETPRTTVESWVRSGRLIRLYRGVYAVGHDALRVEGRWLAAVLACGESAALSFAAAAGNLELRSWNARVIDVSVPKDRRQQRGIRLHRSGCLEEHDVVIHRGIPTTTPTRTLIDLATRLPLDALESVAARAEMRGLIDYAQIDARAPAKLRKVLGRGPKLSRAEAEAKLLRAMRKGGFPEPDMNHWLTHGGGEMWQPDMLFRAERVIVEIDDDSHKTAAAFELDRLKDTVRQADGWATPRVTLRQIDDALPAVLARLRAVLRARGRRFPS